MSSIVRCLVVATIVCAGCGEEPASSTPAAESERPSTPEVGKPAHDASKRKLTVSNTPISKPAKPVEFTLETADREILKFLDYSEATRNSFCIWWGQHLAKCKRLSAEVLDQESIERVREMIVTAEKDLARFEDRREPFPLVLAFQPDRKFAMGAIDISGDNSAEVVRIVSENAAYVRWRRPLTGSPPLEDVLFVCDFSTANFRDARPAILPGVWVHAGNTETSINGVAVQARIVKPFDISRYALLERQLREISQDLFIEYARRTELERRIPAAMFDVEYSPLRELERRQRGP
jgi:hypothetical protein